MNRSLIAIPLAALIALGAAPADAVTYVCWTAPLGASTKTVPADYTTSGSLWYAASAGGTAGEFLLGTSYGQPAGGGGLAVSGDVPLTPGSTINISIGAPTAIGSPFPSPGGETFACLDTSCTTRTSANTFVGVQGGGALGGGLGASCGDARFNYGNNGEGYCAGGGAGGGSFGRTGQGGGGGAGGLRLSSGPGGANTVYGGGSGGYGPDEKTGGAFGGGGGGAGCAGNNSLWGGFGANAVGSTGGLGGAVVNAGCGGAGGDGGTGSEGIHGADAPPFPGFPGGTPGPGGAGGGAPSADNGSSDPGSLTGNPDGGLMGGAGGSPDPNGGQGPGVGAHGGICFSYTSGAPPAPNNSQGWIY